MRRSILPLALAASLAAGVALAQGFSSLEERMTAAEFRAAGLDKLSDEELANLNAWLAREVSRGGLPAATPMAEDRRGFLASSPTAADAIVTGIEGEFRGWKGKGDRITLANGQIWEIVDVARPLSIQTVNPTIVIEPGALGSWELRVEGYNTRAKVRRIK